MGFTFLLGATCLSAMITPLSAEAMVESVASVKQELSVSQTEWLAKLEKCESNGSTTIKVLDTNNKFSFGALQFQAKTFLTQGVKYGLIATATEEVEPLIYNRELQVKLAHKMLLDGGEDNWYNCVRNQKLGKYPK